MQMHLEWRTPKTRSQYVDGRNRANSGVKIQGLYEIQILETYVEPTYVNGMAGSVYKQSVPLVDSLNPAGEWQSYDIIYQAPKFNTDGQLHTPAFVTVLLNGVLVQNHFAVQGITTHKGEAKYGKAHECKPIVLQDHGSDISFQNIWVRKL